MLGWIPLLDYLLGDDSVCLVSGHKIYTLRKKTSLWESFLPFSATNSCKCIPHEMTYREKVILEGTWMASQRFAKHLFWTSSTIFIFAKFFKFKVYKLKSQTIHQVQYTCIVKYSIVIALLGVSSFSSAQWCNKINLPTSEISCRSDWGIHQMGILHPFAPRNRQGQSPRVQDDRYITWYNLI